MNEVRIRLPELTLDGVLERVFLALVRRGIGHYARRRDYFASQHILDANLAILYEELCEQQDLDVRFAIFPHRIYGTSLSIENELNFLQVCGFFKGIINYGSTPVYVLPDLTRAELNDEYPPRGWDPQEWRVRFGRDYWDSWAVRLIEASDRAREPVFFPIAIS